MAIFQILAAILHLSNVEVKDQYGDRSSILVKIFKKNMKTESLLQNN